MADAAVAYVPVDISRISAMHASKKLYERPKLEALKALTRTSSVCAERNASHGVKRVRLKAAG